MLQNKFNIPTVYYANIYDAFKVMVNMFQKYNLFINVMRSSNSFIILKNK